MRKKKPEFVQLFKNVSPIFVIKNNNNRQRVVRERKLEELKTEEYRIEIEFSAPELDAYDLRTLVYLVANINVDKESLGIEETLDNKELIEALRLRLQPTQKGKFSKAIVLETNWSKILSQIGLKYHPDNISKIKQSLKYLQMSIFSIKVKEEKTGKTRLELTSSLLMFQADSLPEDKRNNKIILAFSPLFYLVAFEGIKLKSTINIEVFQKLFEIDVNMVIVYYALCDKVEFGKEREFTIEELEYMCYGNIAKDKSTRSRRKKFLLDSLKEIEKLSNKSFIIKLDKEKIKVKRIPDRKIQKLNK
jgi:hypothetical protein